MLSKNQGFVNALQVGVYCTVIANCNFQDLRLGMYTFQIVDLVVKTSRETNMEFLGE